MDSIVLSGVFGGDFLVFKSPVEFEIKKEGKNYVINRPDLGIYAFDEDLNDLKEELEYEIMLACNVYVCRDEKELMGGEKKIRNKLLELIESITCPTICEEPLS